MNRTPGCSLLLVYPYAAGVRRVPAQWWFFFRYREINGIETVDRDRGQPASCGWRHEGDA